MAEQKGALKKWLVSHFGAKKALRADGKIKREALKKAKSELKGKTDASSKKHFKQVNFALNLGVGKVKAPKPKKTKSKSSKTKKSRA